MDPATLLALLRFAPLALDAGISIVDTIRSATSKAPSVALSPVMQYASNVLTAVPTLIDAGKDATAILKRANEKVRAMVAAGVDPTPADWDEVNGLIAAELKVINA